MLPPVLILQEPRILSGPIFRGQASVTNYTILFLVNDKRVAIKSVPAYQ